MSFLGKCQTFLAKLCAFLPSFPAAAAAAAAVLPVLCSQVLPGSLPAALPGMLAWVRCLALSTVYTSLAGRPSVHC
jgi:hypothetical protein